MRLSDFDYSLPEEKIAFFPLKDRPAAKMLYCGREAKPPEHRNFSDLPDILQKGDVLIFNDTKVLPARLFGKKETGGKVEILLLEQKDQLTWDALVKPGAKIKKGTVVEIGEDFKAQVLDDSRKDSGRRELRFETADFYGALHRYGHMPLPPYISRADQDSDEEDYQTVFASKEGAIAAPTAGLHFDQNLLDRLKERGVEIDYVTLYVGYGTFQPIQTDEIDAHDMFEESYVVSSETAERVNRAKRENRRVIACGTTCVRTMESSVQDGRLLARESSTKLFIKPGFQFQIIDGLITNFHFPKSTLLVLVSAFMGFENMKKAYDVALANDYRFASYGDGMLIL